MSHWVHSKDMTKNITQRPTDRHKSKVNCGWCRKVAVSAVENNDRTFYVCRLHVGTAIDEWLDQGDRHRGSSRES